VTPALATTAEDIQDTLTTKSQMSTMQNRTKQQLLISRIRDAVLRRGDIHKYIQ